MDYLTTLPSMGASQQQSFPINNWSIKEPDITVIRSMMIPGQA